VRISIGGFGDALQASVRLIDHALHVGVDLGDASSLTPNALSRSR
jgi:hypothetical protein